MVNKNRSVYTTWKKHKVKEIALSIQYGYTESSSKEKVGPKFLRITDIQDNKIDWGKVPYCEITDEEKEKYKLQEGDLVFARTGATVGKSCLIKGNIPDSVFASYLIRLRFPDNVDSKFIAYFFQAPFYWQQITENKVGIGMPNVNGTKLGGIQIPIPPLPEQEQIVAKIEELFSELDAGVENIKTAQEQLKVYRQSLLKWAFEGKLTNEDECLGWTIKEVGEFAKVKGGKRLPKGASYSESKTKYPYIRVTDFERQSINVNNLKYLSCETQEKIKRYTISSDDVYISIAGTIGATGTIPEILSGANLTENAAKICEIDGCDKKYLSFFLSSINGQTQIKEKTKTTTQPKLSLYRIESIQIPIPPLAEQLKIVEELESRLTVCDKLEEDIEFSLARAESLRQSILKQAFEGKLVNFNGEKDK